MTDQTKPVPSTNSPAFEKNQLPPVADAKTADHRAAELKPEPAVAAATKT